MTKNTDDLRIAEMEELISPARLIEELPISSTAETVSHTRQAIHNILTGKDQRVLVVVGPVPSMIPTLQRLRPTFKKIASRLSKDLFLSCGSTSRNQGPLSDGKDLSMIPI